MTQKVLISGAAGYISSGLVGVLLQYGYQVLAVDNGFGRTLDALIPYAGHPNFEFIKGDIANDKVLDKIESVGFDVAVLSHCLVGEPITNKYPEFTMRTNADSVDIFCRRFPKAPIIYPGTGSSYGKVDGVCTENSPTNPLSLYAISKLYAEDHIRHHNPHIIYRFATAFGIATSSFRLDLLINDLTFQAVKSKSITIFQADFRRTFCHVKDLIDALIFAIENFDLLEGEIYNVGDNNNNWSKRRLAEFLKEKTGCSVFYGNCGYIDNDKRDYEVSYNKINTAGWQTGISMEEGVQELIKVVPLLDLKNQYNFVG